MEAGHPPFCWQPPPTVLYRRRRPPSPPLLSSPLALILLFSLALLCLFLVVRGFNQRSQSHYNPPDYPHQIPNPIPHTKPIYSLGRSWDALSVALIVAAILCGVFARRKEALPLPPVTVPDIRSSHFVVPRNNYSSYYRMQNQFCVPAFQQQQLQQQQWFQFAQNQNFYGFYPSGCNYAWHRREPVPAAARADDGTAAGDGIEIRDIPVDTFVDESVLQDSETKNSASASPQPNAPPVSRIKPMRIYRSVPRKEKAEKSAPPPPAPPPRPSPPPAPVQQDEKKLKTGKSNGTKEIDTALASLYSDRKTNRKQERHSQQVSHNLDERATQDSISPQSPPSPPSPPPPASVFNGLFGKSSKQKKIHSVSFAPPPPSMAPPSRHAKRKSQIPPISQPPSGPPTYNPPPRRQTTASGFRSRKPPLPARLTSSGSESPPPLLPPPYRITATKSSAVGGDRFVRIPTAQTSRAASPEPEEEVDLTATVNEGAVRPSTEGEMNGGDESGASPSIFCPSPDVNAKADMFIARHHDSWRLERLNSWREKQEQDVGLVQGPLLDYGPRQGPM